MRASERGKVVVVGGAGFMGSHLADALSDAGYAVTIFDISPSRWLRESQTMVVGDVMDAQALRGCCRDARYVYHLAGVADIGAAAAAPRKTIEMNVVGSLNVMEACVESKVERFMFASTVYVYSDKGSFYRVSKQAVESIVEVFNAQYGLDYTILRYGSLYGPRAQAWNGLKRWVTQAVKIGRIVYPGEGLERREYIHVKDAARLSVRALSEEFSRQCLTVTGAQIMTVKDVLNMIGEICGLPIDVEFSQETSDYKTSHYALTPYRYTPKRGRKLVPDYFVDLGQGILDLVEELDGEHNGSGEDSAREL
ncbi:MAG: NAD-dependent epimerase/dehydratase family protein [Desulfovibrionaceae bacterium]